MPSQNGKNRVRKGSIARPLLSLPMAHPCRGCGDCCSYLAIEIDDPQSFTDYENTHWYLSHRGVSIHVDWDGDWFIEFEASCEKLTDRMTCAIYGDRPKICSEFSSDECERNTKEQAWKYRFETSKEFLRWHRKHRPKSFAKYLEGRRKLKAERRKKKEDRPVSTGKAAPRVSRAEARASV